MMKGFVLNNILRRLFSTSASNNGKPKEMKPFDPL